MMHRLFLIINANRILYIAGISREVLALAGERAPPIAIIDQQKAYKGKLKRQQRPTRAAKWYDDYLVGFFPSCSSPVSLSSLISFANYQALKVFYQPSKNRQASLTTLETSNGSSASR